MKIAVTGATGFIGMHVLKVLERHPVEIIAVARNPKRLPESVHIHHAVSLDIANPGTDCFEKLGRPDVLIHLAWDGLPNYKSLHHFETELPRQFRFLKALIDSGLPSLFVAGTCFEYGMQSGPLSADIFPRPSNPYGFAKDALRQQLQFLNAIKPFNLTWGRLFYLYGEGQSCASLYSLIKEAVLRGDKVFNMSGGEQLRDYLPVEEVAKRIVNLSIGGDSQGVVNICSGKPISVRNLVEQWLVEHHWKIELNLGYYPYPDYEPMAFWGVDQHIVMSSSRRLS
jgi:nucleoside-diphosphate-sugar epimerase